ncbi:MAG: hypothetical protein AAF682_01825 [Planctomycetota bacterium]
MEPPTAALETLPCPLLAVAGDGSIAWRNAAARALVGAEGDLCAVLGTDCAESLLAGRGSVVAEHAHGAVVASASALGNGLLLVTLVEAGELASRARRGEQGLAALEELARRTSSLAHEIKNPVTAVHLALQAVARALGEDERETLEDLVGRLRGVEGRLRELASGEDDALRERAGGS